jgi:transposase
MGQFPSADHLASWSGVCPGNNESGGKTSKGSRWLRLALSQAAWAASRKKDSYFQAQFRRLAGRGGKKRALISVARSRLLVIYHLLKKRTTFKDLGRDYFDKLNSRRLVPYLVKRILARLLRGETTILPALNALVYNYRVMPARGP